MTNRSPDNLPEVTGVILAGGLSSRMGSNKALLPYRSGRFIESIHRQLASLFGEVLVVANNPGLYDFLGCRIVPDLHPGLGVLAGLHAGLSASRSHHIFAVACDMPYLNARLIAELVSRRGSADVIIPEGDKGLEPLHAVYGKACLPHMEAALLDNRRRVISFFPEVRVLQLERSQVAALDPEFRSFLNINTPEEYFDLRNPAPKAPVASNSEDSRLRI